MTSDCLPHQEPEKSARQVLPTGAPDTTPSTPNGPTLFRTGDLGRLRPDGLLEILGREDAQVLASECIFLHRDDL